MTVTRRSEPQMRVDRRHREGHQGFSGAAQAMRFATMITVAGLGFLVVAALWVSTCTESIDVDTAACGVPQRTVLGLGAPLILFSGAVWAFVSTYRAWRARQDFWGWQGAGFFLFTVMLVTMAMGFPAVAGPAFGS